jgi:hypothetical protein
MQNVTGAGHLKILDQILVGKGRGRDSFEHVIRDRRVKLKRILGPRV